MINVIRVVMTVITHCSTCIDIPRFTSTEELPNAVLEYCSAEAVSVVANEAIRAQADEIQRSAMVQRLRIKVRGFVGEPFLTARLRKKRHTRPSRKMAPAPARMATRTWDCRERPMEISWSISDVVLLDPGRSC